MGGRMYADTDRYKHFLASKDQGLKGDHRYVEVRYDDATCTTIDEICTSQLHLERMDDGVIWMSVNGLHVWLRTKRGARIEVVCEPDDCEPVVVTRETSETGA